MRRTEFRASVKSLSADAGKFELKLLVDLSDVSAHEGLVSLRGKDVLVTVEQVQQEMEFPDE